MKHRIVHTSLSLIVIIMMLSSINGCSNKKEVSIEFDKAVCKIYDNQQMDKMQASKLLEGDDNQTIDIIKGNEEISGKNL